jgi:hypothetical protein
MANKNKLREWATPLTMGAFFLSGSTGILHFFKVNLPLVTPVHEWLSWLLVIGTLLHIVANWRVSLHYALKPLGRGILILFLLLICVSVIPFEGISEHNPAMKAVGAMMAAPLEAVAPIAGHKGDEMIAILESKGMRAANKGQTIAEIAKTNRTHPIHVLDAIF